MTGLGRLFADDTLIEHIANDEDSLQDMVNSDLKITPKCLCNSTSLNEATSKSKLKGRFLFLELKTIISF
jgi:hypothetical protein